MNSKCTLVALAQFRTFNKLHLHLLYTVREVAGEHKTYCLSAHAHPCVSVCVCVRTLKLTCRNSSAIYVQLF